MKKLIIGLIMLACSSSIFAQNDIYDPIQWKFESTQINDSVTKLIFNASIDEGWYLYSQNIDEGGPIPTSFYFDELNNATLLGTTNEPGGKVEYSDQFEMDLKSFTKQAAFNQDIHLLKEPLKIKGQIEFMACTDVMCLAPQLIDFYFPYESNEGSVDTSGVNITPLSSYQISNIDLENPVLDCGDKKENKSMWGIFILGILGGFIALLTPCVFPMIPLTVSFFTKGSENKQRAILRATFYGISIFLIYLLLSLPFHLMQDINPEILNQISTNTWLNLLFFLIFMFFAFSFFGYYELTLPNRWANKTDSASNTSGILGIFFMALTLAIVSFSCTGPILGSLLAGTLSSANASTINFLGLEMQLVAAKLSLGMAGFGLALGLPFALFAAFPSWLQSLPKSGGWLNSVKVILGFLEVALAIKFLSNADLVEQWGLLKRETFFALWTITFAAMGLYLLGKIKFSHDSPIEKLGITRITFSGLTFAFVIYLFPGIIGQNWWNHSLLSGFPPPKYYSYFNEEHHDVVMDYEEGLAKAKKENSPIMIDFTGWACVNCRKMEDDVFQQEKVKSILKEYVIISLYVDEKTLLDEKEVIEIPMADGSKKLKEITTIGQKWSTLETLTFKNNTQPLYVLLSPNEELLANPIGYNYARDVNKFVEYLECGLTGLKSLK